MVVTHKDPSAAASEAFRTLRTNLQFLGVDKPLRTYLVTSATPSEGKTTTSANLAVAFAQTGARVCLVDADLRRPTLAKVFGLDNWSGLTTVLIGQADYKQCIQENIVPGLSVLTSGPIPPNPAELLGSQQMDRVLRELESSYDVVIFDSPPVLAVTDACVLSAKVNGVILVVRAGQVGYPEVIRARDALNGVKANILGAVLDGIKPSASDGYYYYYYSSKEPARSRSR